MYDCTWPTSPDHSRSIGLCYERIRLRSDTGRTFQITEDSNPAFRVSYRSAVSDPKREPYSTMSDRRINQENRLQQLKSSLVHVDTRTHKHVHTFTPHTPFIISNKGNRQKSEISSPR